MIKAILFDFGGVIYQHPKEVIPEVLARIYHQPIETAIKVYSKYKSDYFIGKLKTNELIKLLNDDFQNNKPIDEVKNLWLEYYAELAKANQEILKLIESVKQHAKVYLFSNTTEMSNLYNSKTGLYDYFDGLFLSYQLGLKKPNKEFYEKVVSDLKLKAEETLFVDDDQSNLVPAQDLGMKTILFDVLKDNPNELTNEISSELR